jgi:outer membrane protein
MGLFSMAGVSHAGNLLEAYHQALVSDPILAQARAALDANLQNKPLARSAWWPHMGVTAGFGEYSSGITGFGAPISGIYPTNNFGVTLTQSIFNGQAWSALAQADQRIKASEATLVNTEQQLAVRVSTAYFGVLQAEALERVAVEQEKLLNTLLDQTQAALEVGTGDVITVHEAKSRRDTAHAARIRAASATTVARRGLQRITHVLPDQLDDVKTLEPLPPLPDRVEEWVNTALTAQPQIVAAEAQWQVAQEQVEYARRARWPVVIAQGGVQHSLGSPFPNLDINQRGAGLNVSLPILDGGQISAQVDQAQAQARESQEALNEVRDEVTLNTQTAFVNLEDSVARFESTHQARASAKISLEGTRSGYEVGTRSIVDVFNDVTNFVQAEQDYQSALYAHVMARLNLKAAAGLLSASDIDTINGLLSP